MALIVADRVQETSTSTGTGTLSLNGAASGFQTFVAGVGNGNTTYYAILDIDTGEWEVGIGTVTSGTPDTLSRDTVLESSNSDALVNFGVGQKNVICTQPAEKAVYLNATGNIDVAGNIDMGTNTITDAKVGQWDTSFGWGNHASAGYQAAATALTTSTTFGGDVSGTYNAIVVADDSHNHIISNVDGLQTALDSKQAAATALTTSTTFGGDVSGTYSAIVVANDSHTHDTRYYTETETGSFFAGTTAITGYNKTNWDTAYGWGNHASAGYLTGNQTITLSGDVSGSGTTSITVTVADDSHNHIISNVDGLQTALDAKQNASTALTTSTSFGGDVSGTYNAIVVANDSHTHDTRYYTETEADSRYVNVTGDTMTGNLTIDAGTSTTLSVKCDDAGLALITANGDSQGTGAIEVGQSGSYGGGISYNGDGSPAFVSGETADHVTFYALNNGTRTEVFHYSYDGGPVNFNTVPTVGGSNTVFHDGYHPNADTLTTARTINGVSFNGSANITVTANTPNTLTRGSYLTGSNFNGSAATTWAVDATSANTASKVVARDASGNFSAGTVTAALSGNATTATTLQTARTINGVSFNGSANITVTANTPNTLTRGSYLTGSNFNGSAATTWAVDATTAATASKVVARDSSGDDFRRYGFASYFNMSHASATRSTDTVFYSSTDDYIRKNDATGMRASLNVPTRTGGDASGTWGISITGNAATATILQTARTINGVSFNGSANITVADATKMPLTGGTFTGNVSFGNFAITDVQTITVDDAIYSTGDTNTYMQFHAADQWRVVTNGAERLEINNSYALFSQNVVNSTHTTTTNGSQQPNFNAYSNFVWTLSGNLTLLNTAVEVAGMSGVFVFIHSGAARTVSLGTDYETAGGAGLTLSSTAGATDIVPYFVSATGRVILGTPQLGFV